MAALSRRKRRIEELEAEVAELQAEVARLRKAARPPAKSTTTTR